MQINNLCDHPLAAEATGLDTRADGWEAGIAAAFADHPVLCLRRQSLDADGYVAAMSRLGRPKKQLHQQYRHPERHEIMRLASDQVDVKGDGRKIVIGTAWHTDDSYMAEPSAVTILQAEILPASGGDTDFADTRQAWDALPEGRRREIEGLKVEHRYYSRRNVGKVAKRTPEEEAQTPPVHHPLVRTHPVTGRKALYCSEAHTMHIEGMTAAESRPLLQYLYQVQQREEFGCRFHWEPGSVAFWDNRCAQHNALNDYHGHRRVMHRVTLEGEVPA